MSFFEKSGSQLSGPGSGTSVDLSPLSVLYDNKLKDVSAQDTSPQNVFFKPDGLKMYIMGNITDTVYQYALSVAWDVSTASFEVGKIKDISAQELTSSGVFFKPDGLKMYVVGTTNDTVYQYALSVAWDVSTASFEVGKIKDVSLEDTNPGETFFKPDGMKMYMVGSDSDAVFQYTLSVAWDVSTATYDTVTLDVSGQGTFPTGLFLSPTGDRMFISGWLNSEVHSYTLSTPWDLSTATYDVLLFNVAQREVNLTGVAFKSDGTKLYTIGATTADSVHQYSLSTAWDLSPKEVDTGDKWVDGKAIYRAALAIPAAAAGVAKTATIGKVVDTLIDLRGSVVRDSPATPLPIPYINASLTLVISAELNAAKNTVTIDPGSALAHSGGFVWLDYTR